MNLPENLTRDILERFDEDAPRLTAADWLDENGDPEAAAFVRRQVRREAHPPERSLAERDADAYEHRPPGDAAAASEAPGLVYARGFPTAFMLGDGLAEVPGAELVSTGYVHTEVGWPDPPWPDLAVLPNLRTFALLGEDSTPDDVRVAAKLVKGLVEHPTFVCVHPFPPAAFTGWQAARLAFVSTLTGDALRRFERAVRAETRMRLRPDTESWTLDIPAGYWPPRHPDTPRPHMLRARDGTRASLPFDGDMPGLVTLSLRASRIEADFFAGLTGLRELSVEFETPATAAELAACAAHLGGLESLRIDNGALTPEQLAALLSASPRLRQVELNRVPLVEGHIDAWPATPELVELRVTGHNLKRRGKPWKPPAPRLMVALFDPEWPVEETPVTWSRRELAFGLSLELPDMLEDAPDGTLNPWPESLAGGAWREGGGTPRSPEGPAGPAAAAWGVYTLPPGVGVAEWLRATWVPWQEGPPIELEPIQWQGREGVRLSELAPPWNRLAYALDLGDDCVLCLRLEYGERLLPIGEWLDGAMETIDRASDL